MIVPDPIMHLIEEFKEDPNPGKINLIMGVYRNIDGITPIFDAVKEAEKLIWEHANTKIYLPILGSDEFIHVTQELLFGYTPDTFTTLHTPGGTGALRVGADFLRHINPVAGVWIGDPSWVNHCPIFKAANLSVIKHPYYDQNTKSIDFDRMRASLLRVPTRCAVLLHACCHNPTGTDLTPEQWKEIAVIASKRGWIPFIDFAYQGFGTSIYEDNLALELLLDEVDQLIVASSYSKNFGLYQDRVGSLTIVSPNAQAAGVVKNQVKQLIRTNYSTPPAHGGHIVSTILSDANLRYSWENELKNMRDRVSMLRSLLVIKLGERGMDYSFVRNQSGLFSFLDLTDVQLKFLKTNRSIHTVGNRINVAGLTVNNIDYVCDSILEAKNLK